MKKIFDAFANPTDAQRTFREILFLQAFSCHDNVVQLLNVIKANNDKDIYLVFEFMGEYDINNMMIFKFVSLLYTQYIHKHLWCKPKRLVINPSQAQHHAVSSLRTLGESNTCSQIALLFVHNGRSSSHCLW